jgi:hypothetical protein
MAEVKQINVVGIDQNVATSQEIFVDGISGLITKDEVVKFNLVADILLSPGTPDQEQNPIARVVRARLVMSKRTFYELTKLLTDAAADFEVMEKQDRDKQREERQ